MRSRRCFSEAPWLTLGSPSAPLTPTQMAAKLALARELASPTCDPRIFDNPIAYFTDPT